MRPISLLLAATMLTAAPVMADDPAKPDKPRTICRTQPSATGSHRPGKRICLTAAAWKARDAGVESYAQPDDRTPIGSSAGSAGQ